MNPYLRLDINSSRSNRCTSCSFFSNAPYSGGISLCWSPRSASGGIYSATNSLIQSSSSEVDGRFFKPGTSRISKKVSNASLSNRFFKSG